MMPKTIILIFFKDKGKYYSLLRNIGIEVYCLNINFYSVTSFLLIKLLNL